MKPNATNANLAVVVPSLTPSFGLLVMQTTPEHRAGETLPLYGFYRSPYDNTETVYTSGTVPNDWRIAIEEEATCNEILFRPLPDLIEEINMQENPGAYEIRVTNCKIIEMPQPEGRQIQFTPATDAPFKPAGECRVIEHPAKARQQKQTAQLSLFPFADNTEPDKTQIA